MKRFRPALFALLAVLTAACANEPTEERAIRSVTDVLDLRVSESQPLRVFNEEESAKVGFDEKGRESRMLVFFPKLRELWEEQVIISSIAVIELLLNCDKIEVNPENIELRPLAQAWSPFATWKSRDLLLGEIWTNPGGDFDASLPAIKPSLRLNPKDNRAYELSFDLTKLVQRMILENFTDYGFMVRVVRSELNASNQMMFSTSNNKNGDRRPSSVLVFSTKDSIGNQ